MDICLLCLELRHTSVEFVKVDAIRLPGQETVGEVIEKHLWPMESINSNSWLCKSCWHILYDFHKFYQRIEEAHEDLANLLDVETSAPEIVEKSPENEIQLIEQNKQQIVGLNKEHQSFDLRLNEDESRKQTQAYVTTALEQSQVLSGDTRNIPKCHSEIVYNIEKSKLSSDEEPMTEDEDEDKDIVDNTRDPLNKPLQPFEDATAVTKLKITEANNNVQQDEILQTPNINPQVNHQEVLRSASEYSQSENQDDELEISDNLLQDSKPGNGSDSSSTTSALVEGNPPGTKASEQDFEELVAKYITLACEICHATMTTFGDLRAHYRNTHNQGYFIKCCNKTFNRPSMLTDHIMWHIDPEYFKCKQCGKLLADRRCLDSHMTNIHANRAKSHTCDICLKSFADPGTLKHHRLTHASEEEKTFRCAECDKSFGSRYLLTNHIRTVHTKTYIKICEICAKEFRVRKKFERHMQEHEGVNKSTVSCDICGFKSVDEASLRRHKRAQHPGGGNMEYKCHVCAKISPSLRAHKTHIRYQHDLDKSFKCSVCDKAFKRSCTLSEHMATHTKIALYTCPHCPQTFKSNGNMHKHRKIVHPLEWEKARREKFSGTSPPPTNQKAATY